MEYKPQFPSAWENISSLHPFLKLTSAQQRMIERIARVTEREVKISTLLKLLKTHHPPTYKHSENVSVYSTELAALSHFNPTITANIRQGALLHDVGKISVPAAILDKTKPLTEEEIRAIVQHSTVGEIILHRAGLGNLAAFAGKHHVGNSLLQKNRYETVIRIDPHVAVVSLADTIEAMFDPSHSHKHNTLTTVIDVIEDKFNRGLLPEFLRQPFYVFIKSDYFSHP